MQDRKAVFINYPQAVPLAFAIDQDTCIGCGLCEKMCLAGAIRYEDQPQINELDVGSIILTTGSRAFDPSKLDYLGYGKYPNVITSSEFERILSASGPYFGNLVRPLDRQEPQKIAWLQCVGSRDINRSKNAHCSSVCCMYAIKEAVIAKEHAHEELDCAIFYMDMRTYGKEFERYYNDAKEKHGVRFIRSRIHTITEDEETGNLEVKYFDFNGEMQSENFDMVVLSVGLEVDPKSIDLAKKMGIELGDGNFCKTSTFLPVTTTRDGIYVSGTFQGPKDIPSSMVDASAASCAAQRDLSEVRHTCTQTLELPEEKDISQEDLRIGVFVCRCGINIAGVVDVDEVTEYCNSLPGVVFADQNLFTCSEDAQKNMKEKILDNNLNRVVVASCTPKTHEPIFMETMESCGLNKYLFEMANIRNQDSWVHANDPKKATEKAKELIRMAVSRAATLKALDERKIPVNPKALVIGGGIAGMNAALSLADQGFETALVEKESELGGFSRNLSHTIDGSDIQSYLKEVIQKVNDHPKIQIFTQSQVVRFSGYKGNFKTVLEVGSDKEEKELDHGVIILATGAHEYKPQEYMYQESNKVLTQVELAKRLEEKGASDINNLVMIQCVGSRNEHNPNCSRICCQAAIKNAIKIKELNPKANVYILYRDIRTYGLLENYYTKARQLGVIFFEFDPEDPPQVSESEQGLMVKVFDPILNSYVEIQTDMVTLSAGVDANDTDDLAHALRIARNEQNHFIEAHVKLRPVDLATEGMYVCGTAHSPMLISEAIDQAYAAASRATTLLSQDYITLSAVTARVDPDKCAACLICVRTCPYGVPRINEEGVSEIDRALCQGCGACAAECPAKAIELDWYEDSQITSKIDALLEGVV